jgi:hypothetical protein
MVTVCRKKVAKSWIFNFLQGYKPAWEKIDVENCRLTKSMFLQEWMDVKANLRIACSNQKQQC